MVWIDPGIFPVDIAFCPSKKAWQSEMKRMGMQEPYPDDSDARCTTFERPGHKVRCIVTLNERCDPKDEIGKYALLVHECVHVWQTVRSTMRESDPSREFEAYSVHYISQEIMTAYCATRMKRKPKRRK
jgi:hypothetical protein